MPDVKPFAGLRFGFLDLDTAHHRRWGAVVKPLNQRGNSGFFASKVRFHFSIGAIPHPTGYAQFLGLLLRPCAEKDALHAARHSHVSADTGHHTTLMSGASSAFIPTTL